MQQTGGRKASRLHLETTYGEDTYRRATRDVHRCAGLHRHAAGVLGQPAVCDIEASVRFYSDVLGVDVQYADPDFAALSVDGHEFMLHADHTYDTHPWHGALLANERRGLGAELRLMGHDADDVERRAVASGAVVLRPAATKGHGIREVIVEDPDGYTWAIGSLVDAR